jgi:hypothetical protein
MALHLQQHQHQPEQKLQPQQQQQLLLYVPEEGEAGLSIKASRDAQYIILTSSVQVSSWQPCLSVQLDNCQTLFRA